MTKTERTARGFQIKYFTDSNGEKCSLQISSAIRDEKLIWLGCDEIGLKMSEPGIGWFDIDTSSRGHRIFSANNRMHLTQSSVKALLPALMHFAQTGELPEEDPEYMTRDGLPAKFIEYRTRGSELSVWEINGVETIRLKDGSYRYDGRESPYDIIKRK